MRATCIQRCFQTAGKHAHTGALSSLARTFSISVDWDEIDAIVLQTAQHFHGTLRFLSKWS